MSAVEKVRLRLPQIKKPTNPFGAGTRATLKRVRRGLAANAAALAANQIPGKGIALGALGAMLGGVQGGAAALGASSAVSTAATALLARGTNRRRKALSYLTARSKRRGVYKSQETLMSATAERLEELGDAIEKAKKGLISGGTRATYRRLADAGEGRGGASGLRINRAARYLLNRYEGGLRRTNDGPKRRRGVYKAKRGMIPGGSSRLRSKFGFASAGSGARSDRAFKLGSYLQRRQRGRLMRPGGSLKGPRRTGVYKALETLDECIEKGRGMISGGSKRVARSAERKGRPMLAELIRIQRRKGGHFVTSPENAGFKRHPGNPYAVGRRTGRYK